MKRPDPTRCLGLLSLIACLALLAACETRPPGAIGEPRAVVMAPLAPARTVSAPSAPASAAPSAPAASVPVAAPVIVPVAFDDAVLKAAGDLLTNAQKAAGPTASRQSIVIDPLIDGVTGAQSAATRSMEARIRELIGASYPGFEVQAFTAANVAKRPIVLVGTFTAINGANQTSGAREAYRICLALADLRSGRIVSKGVARARLEGVDITPTPYYADSPAWAADPATASYIKTCQGTRPGDPIDAVYADRILVGALVNDAINAYEARRYGESLDLYRSALATPGGEQLRVLNGIYLANWKLGRRSDAEQAFGKIVDYGLASKRLAVRLLFSPGSTQFWPDPRISAAYPVWLAQIAQRSAQGSACLEIVGHTSRSGPEPLNERLSVLRAELVKQRLEAQAPDLRRRSIATGAGSREALVGIGSDDARDAPDRRVEFKVVDCG